MTDKISRMYELASVANIGYDSWEAKDIYPPFTDTKQLELIKWIFRQLQFSIQYAFSGNQYGLIWHEDVMHECWNADFSQALAGLVSELWEDLTDTQREEIKRILE